MAAPHRDVDVLPDADAPPHLPEGLYQLRFLHWETAIMFGKARKLILHFRVIQPGEYFDTITLHAFYNVKRLVGRPGRYGGFKVGWRSSFLRDYVNLFHRDVKRLDRTPMSEFEKHIIVGKVKTVTTTYDQEKLPKSLQYSVISDLVRIEAP